MPGLVVVGAQWGDEGKGKLVDYLTSSADSVVRFQGGNNAGHTLVVDGETTKLHLIPSGILRSESTCFIAAGVVVDPDVFWKEVSDLKARGVKVEPSNLVIDRDAHLILPYHKATDIAREEARGLKKIGTTGRGIGPAYEDRANRSGVRIAELSDLESLREKVKTNYESRVSYLEKVLEVSNTLSFDEVWSSIERAKENLSPYIGNASYTVNKHISSGKKVVFEGAQGTFLDQVHGTLPFVTSSNTIAGAVTTGVGIGPKAIDYVLGVAKAYTTRVGSGPFPTELTCEIGDRLVQVGAEFGTTTGRKRRCGWFDAFLLKRAVRLNGMDGVALTKLDVLTGINPLKICVSYKLDGEKLKDLPALSSKLELVEPQFIELEGWEEDLTNVTKWHHLPAQARFYISTISEIIGAPITMVSVGPERDSTIFSSGSSFVKNFYKV